MGVPPDAVRPTVAVTDAKPKQSPATQPDCVALGAPSTKADPDQKLQFLYKALDDNQGVIRLLDAKAAFAIALLSAMTGKVLADLPFYFPLAGQQLWRKSLLFGFWGFGLMSGFIVFRVIFPVTNPTKNVKMTSGDCKPQFFLWHFEPKSWMRIWSRAPRFSTLALKQETFLEEMKEATTDSLLVCLTGEVMKVSYIRQIKTDRLRAVGYFLFISSVLFVLLITAQSLAPKMSSPQKVQVEGAVEIHDKANDQSSPVGNQPGIARSSKTRHLLPKSTP
jgi:hypothetical protein